MHTSSNASGFRELSLVTGLVISACSTTDTVATAANVEAGAGDSGSYARDGGSEQPPSDADAAPDECNKVEIRFESKTPTVFILVDRSSSMFERGLWEPLKGGVLSIVDQLDEEVRFGFSTYTGAPGGVCPELTASVTIEEGNYSAIKATYDGIAPPTYKGETPTSRAIDEVVKILAAESEDTSKYILLVTDGEPDFCDDPNVTCSRDAVVASTQAAKAMGIGTFIFSVGGSVDAAHLQDVANAGSGQGVEDRQMAVFYQCNGGTAVYSAQPGNAAFYEPSVNDQAALVSELAGVVAGVRSCIFDLQGKVIINLNAADQGMVEIDGKVVPFGDPDGYRMNSPTQLELLGKACSELRKPESKNVFIDFPCEAVVLL